MEAPTVTKTQLQVYQSLVRVRDFGITHREHFPESSTGGKAFTAVAGAAAAIEAHATTTLLTAEEGKKRKAAARQAVAERLATISRTARELARTVPGADSGFKPLAGRSDVALITTARAFIDKGQAVIEQFVTLGLPETFVADLREATDALEQAVKGRQAGKAGLSQARAGLKAALAEGTQAVRTLDVIVENTLADDPVLVALWQRERRVAKGKTTTAPKTDSPPAPATAPLPAPATVTGAPATPATQDALPKAS